MLKIVVFDSGFGGELFADRLEEILPIVEVVRVIDWRHSSQIIKSARSARKAAEMALKPYFGKVDLIIFANYLLSATSLKYFRRKYESQKFLGLEFDTPDTFVKHNVLILTTSAVARAHAFHKFTRHLHRPTRTLALDTWPTKIDDGELTFGEIGATLAKFRRRRHFVPREIIFACTQFKDIEPDLKKLFGARLFTYDGFDDAIRAACHVLCLRGGTGKK